MKTVYLRPFIGLVFLAWTGLVCAQPIPFVPIYDIQGEGHVSPEAGNFVVTQGVITAIGFRALYVQDPNGDRNNATSDAIFVFDFGWLSRTIGECIELEGVVSEFIAGGAATGNLSTTQMFAPSITVIDCEATFGPGYSFPVPTVIGFSGRVPPNEITISEDEIDPPINLQLAADDAANNFDPYEDGIDFYESMESMLVTVEDAQAVSATRRFGTFSAEFFTVPNRADPAIIEPNDAMTQRGGIVLQPDPDGTGDLNPERVQVQLSGIPLYPGDMNLQVKVGDLVGDITGVVGYSFGNFEVNATHVIDVVDAGLTPETTSINSNKKRVTVASYNVLNLSPLPSDDNQRATLASQIVNNLRTPDVIALQEIQDNNGTTDDSTTDATETLQALVDAIALAGGPDYAFFDVAPADGTSGGVPGGNIRNAFLYNPDRVDMESFVSLTPAVLTAASVGDPDAFDGTRDPLAATFEFDGKEFTVINNHLTSRFGSTPVFGGPQPFVQAGEAAREAQTQALNEYVDSLLADDKDARVIVLGDLNTFEFTNDLTEILPGTMDGKAVMKTLLGEVEDDNRYTFIFDGNSQVLDHVFATRSLLERAELDIVHVNVDFPRVFNTVVGSDHEPLVAGFMLRR
jgi:predicted extracellular nuclease